MFGSTKEDLSDVRSLIASVAKGFPAGALLTLETGGEIEQRQGLAPETLDEILRTHLIEPAHLRKDDFEAFFEARMTALAGVVAAAMEKSIVDEQGANETETDVAPEEQDDLE